MFVIARVLSQRLEPGIYENRNLLVLIATYGVSLVAAIGPIEVHLSIPIDLLVKAVLLPFLIGILILFKVTTIAEMHGALRRPKRRSLEESDEAELAARKAEEVAAATDDTGFSPDNRA